MGHQSSIPLKFQYARLAKEKEDLRVPLFRYNLCGVRTTCSLVVFSGSVVVVTEAVAEYHKQSEQDKGCWPDHIVYKQA